MQQHLSEKSSKSFPVGRPARACDPCRKRRLKCDKGHPTCSRCLANDRLCDIYRYPQKSEYIFRDQRLSIQRTINAAENVGRRGNQARNEPGLNSPSSGISRSAIQQAMEFLLVNFVSSAEETDSGLGFQDLTPLIRPMYLSEKDDSPLRLILHAIGSAIYSRRSRQVGFMQEAVNQYHKAVNRLRHAIKTPEIAKKNSTILAALLFGAWEVLKTNFGRDGTWNVHIDGVAALIRYRGQSMLDDDVSCRLLLVARNLFAIRNMMVFEGNKRVRPVEDLGPEWFPWSSPDSPIGFINTLTNLGMQIAKLRGVVRPLMHVPITAQISYSLAEIAQKVIGIDEQLCTWTSSIPEAWSYVTVATAPASDSREFSELFYPGPIDHYPTFGTENIWNRWRAYRIYAHMLIINCLERLEPSPHSHESHQIMSSIKILRDMVNQVCSSIPYILGYWQMHDITWNVSNDPSEKIKSHVLPLRRWSLLYILTVSYEVIGISLHQRDWIHRRRESLWTVHGLEQAEVIGRLSYECLSDNQRHVTLIDLAPSEGQIYLQRTVD